MEDFITRHGRIVHQDALEYMRSSIEDNSIDLIFTSPPFALLRKKDYGNVEEDKYVAWFKEFAHEFYRVLKPTGSLVIDIGGTWKPGQPTRSLYHFELLIMLCRQVQFHLAQEFYWWNPSKLPTPAEWVNVRRIRVKDAVNCVFWLSKTPWPKASNRRVLVPYSDSMLDLIENGYQAKLRPSGHDISDKFQRDNGGAIPPNLLAIPNTESNSYYLRYCKEHDIKPHPARFPSRLPELFVRMLTDAGDTVFDPFGGSCVTGEVCELLERSWICCETVPEYIEGAKGRFVSFAAENEGNESDHYKIYSPSVLWNGSGTEDYDALSVDGGQKRPDLSNTNAVGKLNGDESVRQPSKTRPKQPTLFD
ncbi:MAG: site-specific DNA-methyltransferase [Chloroflexi bacterium]|nr:site-specific DNA-methyltransferase [Ardenticatenaceae bacterium]MBL1130326.1 site-specific DNA-methyltransferase [Chloroflexota bacterium]NOG36417.1 site-specific DNA-methyltransferase [Chloroflexota bacterium]GIK57819.1 MAG: methyltransferase [Chloroflexota bacterium]